MSDVADISSDVEQLYRDSAIHQGRKVFRKYPAKGSCYNCDEPFTVAEQIYCDSDCRIDHEKRERNSIKIT